jgi:hypothetical protein
VEVTVLRAVFVRTLKPGVTYEQFRDAWLPEDAGGSYPAKISVGRNVDSTRQVITILELDMSREEFEQKRGALTRPDALDRLASIVDTTELAGLYEEVFGNANLLNAPAE